MLLERTTVLKLRQSFLLSLKGNLIDEFFSCLFRKEGDGIRAMLRDHSEMFLFQETGVERKKGGVGRV